MNFFEVIIRLGVVLSYDTITTKIKTTGELIAIFKAASENRGKCHGPSQQHRSQHADTFYRAVSSN